MTVDVNINRRKLLIAGGAFMLMPRFAYAKSQSIIKANEKSLNMHNIHTGEKFKQVFWADGQFDHQAIEELNRIMRDRRSGDITTMNRKLYIMLNNIANQLDAKNPIELVCGYRSAETNEKMRKSKIGIARKSKHITGDAIDFYITGHSLKEVRNVAVSQQLGGVGYYPSSNFIHADIRDKPAKW